MDEINRKRLEWVAQAKPGAMDWGGDLFVTDGNPAAGWGEAMSAAAQAALDEIAELDRTKGLLSQLMERWTWRPIADAPLPAADAVPDYWRWNCLLQTERGWVGEGAARYVTVKGKRETSTRILRWYMNDRMLGGDNGPKYFMPLPAKRED